MKFLKQLQKIPYAKPFKYPVDFKALELFDYPEIIKNPMDFDKIDAQCKQRKYKSHSEFFADLQLIWDNCKLYNQEGSPIFSQALQLEKITNNAKSIFE